MRVIVGKNHKNVLHINIIILFIYHGKVMEKNIQIYRLLNKTITDVF